MVKKTPKTGCKPQLVLIYSFIDQILYSYIHVYSTLVKVITAIPNHQQSYPGPSHSSRSTSSMSICSNSSRPTSSTCALLKAATSQRFCPHTDFMMVSSSNTIGPKHARRSVAICLVPENMRSHGTDDA